MTWIFKRNTRRVLCVLAICLLVTSEILNFNGEAFVGLGTLLILLYVILVFWLSHATSHMALGVGKALDERQKALRDKAYRWSYIAFAVFGFLMTILNVLGWGNFRVLYGVGNMMSINSLLVTWNFILLTALPVLCIAWLEPNPILDEPREMSAA